MLNHSSAQAQPKSPSCGSGASQRLVEETKFEFDVVGVNRQLPTLQLIG